MRSRGRALDPFFCFLGDPLFVFDIICSVLCHIGKEASLVDPCMVETIVIGGRGKSESPGIGGLVGL